MLGKKLKEFSVKQFVSGYKFDEGFLLELSVEFRSCNNSANADLQIRISIQTNVLALLVHQGFNSKLSMLLLPSTLKQYFWFYVLYGFEVSLLSSHSAKGLPEDKKIFENS